MGYVISVANNKGGVGKSTTALNLADALGRMGKRVCLIDMDSQCNATDVLLPKTSRITKSLYEILHPDEDIKPIDAFFYMSTAKNVMLIPNIYDTGLVEPEIITRGSHAFLALRTFVRETLTPHYDYVLVDTPPNMGTFVLMSLLASDFVIVPVRAGSTNSVIGLNRMCEMIREIQAKPLDEGGNPDLKFLRLLINAADRRTQVSKTVIAKVRSDFAKEEVFDTEIPINTCFEVAEAQRETVFQCDSSSGGARAFRKLAKELDDGFSVQQSLFSNVARG